MQILVADEISEQGVQLLRDGGNDVDVKLGLKEDELVKIVPGFDAIVVRSATKITRKVIEAGTSLRLIGRAGIGVDNIDVEAATARGILVMNAPSGNVVSTAEHTIGMIFALARNIPQADASVRRGEWKRKEFVGLQLTGKTLGILGLGKVGTEVARRASGLGMTVIAFDPIVAPEAAVKLHVRLVPLDRLLREADIVSVHTPLTPQTTNLIGAEQLRKMKPGAILINCARGGIVNEEALHEALAEKRLAGAALDVYVSEPPKGSPLLALPNIVFTPHLGASTREAQEEVGREIAEQILAYFRTGEIQNAVNLPARFDPELAPFMPLAEKLGTFASQLSGEKVKAVEICAMGDLARRETRLLAAGALTGLLRPLSEGSVNYINAFANAKERGIAVTTSAAEELATYRNLLRLTVKTEDSPVEVAGSLIEHKGPRIVRLQNYEIELELSGHFLVISHQDKPGMIGRVGTLLGKHDINIAGMQVGREKVRGNAFMVLTLDDPLTPRILEEIRGVEGLERATAVKL